VWKYQGEELRLGLDLHYRSFDKNLRYFTYGQGGYFSPQREQTAMVPIVFHNQLSRDLWYELRGSVGYQQFGEASTPYYPVDSALQSALVQAAASNSTLSSSFKGTQTTGVAGGLSGEVTYRLTRDWSIGARASFLQSGVYQQYGAAFYARYILNGLYDQ
jgi:hypothetical protein